MVAGEEYSAERFESRSSLGQGAPEVELAEGVYGEEDHGVLGGVGGDQGRL